MNVFTHSTAKNLTWLLIAVFLASSLLFGGCSQQEENKLAIGDTAPGFSLASLEGKALKLADMKGSPVLLRFFLTDCKYCRADTPVFNEFYTKYHDKGLQVLYVDSLGIKPEVVKTFVRELGIVFPVAQDMGGKVTAKYRVRALPQTIVLDPQHKIIAAILGSISEQELERLLEPYLIN